MLAAALAAMNACSFDGFFLLILRATDVSFKYPNDSTSEILTLARLTVFIQPNHIRRWCLTGKLACCLVAQS